MYINRHLEELDCHYRTGRRRGKDNSKHHNLEQLTDFKRLADHDTPNNDDSQKELSEGLPS